MPDDRTPLPAGSLRWVVDVIDAVEVPGAAGAAAGELAVLPSAANPRLLVPLGSRRAAARSVRARDYGVGRRERASRALLALGLRAGAVQPFASSRVTVGPALATHLRSVLGREDVLTAVRVGRRRPNSKPLVTVLDRAGSVLAYAKLGWNPLTRGLIRQEAEMLAWLAERETRCFAPPRVLGLGRCGTIDVLVVSPVRGRTWRPSHADATFAALTEIAGLTGATHGPLATSPYWQRQRRRAGGAHALPALMERVDDVHGDQVLSFGGSHGDWAPWNVARARDGLAVWDWERAAGDRPTGLDAAHFDLQLAGARSGKGAVHALEATLRSGGLLLPRLATSASARRALLALELVEMCLRHEEAGAGEATPQLTAHLRALETLLG
jgi:hypothetical protein